MQGVNRKGLSQGVYNLRGGGGTNIITAGNYLIWSWLREHFGWRWGRLPGIKNRFLGHLGVERVAPGWTYGGGENIPPLEQRET